VKYRIIEVNGWIIMHPSGKAENCEASQKRPVGIGMSKGEISRHGSQWLDYRASIGKSGKLRSIAEKTGRYWNE
jgi:hypothetical protein